MKFPIKVVDLCKMLDANKAEDIVVCDSTKMQNSVDYFIIATATSIAHIRGIVENVTMKTSENKELYGTPLREGFGLCNWVILSYEDVFLNVFTKEERNRYNLEKLLNDGKNLITFKRLLSNLKAEEKKEKANLKKALLKEEKEKRLKDCSKITAEKVEKKEIKERKERQEKKEIKIKKDKKEIKVKKEKKDIKINNELREIKEKKLKKENKEKEKTEKLNSQKKRESDK